MNPRDRDLLCFLWVDNINKDTPEILMLSFRWVMFGVASSPFLFIGTTKYHIEVYQTVEPEFMARFLHLICIDDVVLRASSFQEAFKLY